MGPPRLPDTLGDHRTLNSPTLNSRAVNSRAVKPLSADRPRI
ncbi:hypothetical protein SSCG_02091 [Streptomyces clavuligerus]|nr:hypothetical protein SSCG_02091 [Streptomyces clavuligerus]